MPQFVIAMLATWKAGGIMVSVSPTLKHKELTALLQEGAMNSHGNVIFNAQAYRDWIGLTDGDVAFGAAPFFHVTGLIGNLGAPLLIGMPIVMSYRFDPGTALELIDRHRATFTAASITAFIALMNAARDHDLSSLRKIVSGGAPIAPATVEAYERQLEDPPARVARPRADPRGWLGSKRA
jgi:acyl-coenzyme A synthetase/AMP-(fatty) acid ligase